MKPGEIERMGKAELQQKLKERNLDDDGPRFALAARLWMHFEQAQKSKSKEDLANPFGDFDHGLPDKTSVRTGPFHYLEASDLTARHQRQFCSTPIVCLLPKIAKSIGSNFE